MGNALRILAVLSVLLACLGTAVAAEGSRRRVLADFDWKFHRGDAAGAEKVTFDDASWRSVDLPHDWSIERVPGSASLFDRNAPSRHDGGYLPGGIGWYRKTFSLPADGQGSRVFVEFEGVYMDSDIWLNGQHLGKHPYGYTSFQYELTPHVNWGQPNVLTVRVNVQLPCSRWFTGAGIYRHVWLTQTAPVHVSHWGTYVTTPKIDKDTATVRVRTHVMNQAGNAQEVMLRTTLRDAAGAAVAKQETNAAIAADKGNEFEQSLQVAPPHLWSLSDPYLYRAVSEVLVGGKVVDTYETPFGIRTIEFTKDRGFFLNGEHTPIYGVCNHHDQGYLGAAAYDRAIERQLEILKSMGCNAIRTSHNPPAPKLLDLCDRMGLVVMDEAFDEWKRNHTKFGYGRFYDQWSERDIRSMLRRDRNHPCVVLWSIGNEIIEQGDAVLGPREAARLAAFCREEDPTRPVTSACNNPGGALKTGFANALDVIGINYGIDWYDRLKDKKTLIASETSSTVSTRGEYNLVQKDGKVVIEPLLNTQVTAYDLYRPPWAIQVELQLKKLKDCPWVAGEFVWTGFDYIGEPTPYTWPAASSYFGIVDLCGFPRDRFYVYQSQWRNTPMVHILPHWNWPGLEGKEIPVWCYTSADSVELYLNGKSLGEKRMADATPKKYIIEPARGKKKNPVVIESGWLHLEWPVPYQAGELKAVAKRGGQVVATDVVATAGKPARLAVEVDRKQVTANGQDLAYVTVRVLDAEGRLCPEADTLVHFDVAGEGRLAAVGNGNPIDHDDYQASQRKAFHGLCLAILKTGKTSGTIRLTARADGLEPANVSVQTSSAPAGATPR
jgi:beta-galactosidase